MNGNTLGTAIAAAIAGLSDTQKENTALVWQTIANQIVTHIQSNAQVSTNVAVASVSGVTTGPGVSGPGTGTGTGTIA